MDVYNVSFKAKIEGVDVWVNVGDEWISYGTGTSAMIKAVCGSYPSDWHGMSCEKLSGILDGGIQELESYGFRYKQFETPNGHGTVEGTLNFLSKIHSNCKRYPYATVDVEVIR